LQGANLERALGRKIQKAPKMPIAPRCGRVERLVHDRIWVDCANTRQSLSKISAHRTGDPGPMRQFAFISFAIVTTPEHAKSATKHGQTR
jgi:hypothetical protein